MKRVVLVCAMLLGMVLPVYATSVSLSSTIQITNAPTNSKWQIECGLSTGVYTLFTKQFTMNVGIVTIPVSSIFDTSGNYFCRTVFVQQYGFGSYSSEINLTVGASSPVTPTLNVVP